MELEKLKENWDALGREDALGVILSYPLRRGDWRVEEFLETGAREIEEVLEAGKRFGVPSARGAALDFGCGVGRLTQAMCSHFDRCVGVDIAPSMLEAAEALNRLGERCRYHLNDSDSLERFGDAEFDLVYSNITLQHIAPRYSRRYIEEFVRVLRPGGLLAFQLPSEREPPRRARNGKLPRNAVLAEIEVADESLTLAAGCATRVRARVRNAGRAVWPSNLAESPIALGNHWLDPSGRTLTHDDGRTPLPFDLKPGQAVELELVVTAPDEPGEYLLELDLVQEGVAWFANRRKLSRRRSQTARVLVRVVRPDEVPTATEASTPVMEMHGIPRAEVLALLAESGARVLEVGENDAAGPGWISLRYLATKDA